MENLDPALLASLDPRALEGLLQSMAASMPTGEQSYKGFTPSEDLKKKEAAMHESKAAYDAQLGEVMKTLSLFTMASHASTRPPGDGTRALRPRSSRRSTRRASATTWATP